MVKTRLLLILVGTVVLLFPTCLPTDENVNPDDPVAKFLGQWKVSEDCVRNSYVVTISQDPGNSSQVLLDNFASPGPGYDPAVGLVVGNTIHVTSQTIGEGWTVSGTGTYRNDNSIAWNYTLYIASSKYTCSATYTK